MAPLSARASAWRRPPARARLVLEVPGAVAVCFDAPVVELLETRAEALHPSLGRSGRTCWRRLRRRRRRSAGCATRRAPRWRSRDALLDQRALAGIGNVYKNEVLLIERVSPFAPVAESTMRRCDRLVATARRLLLANARATRGAERSRPTGDRGAPGAAVCLRPRGRPCRRCRTPIAVARARARELPRTTYWCPVCQGSGIGS